MLYLYLGVYIILQLLKVGFKNLMAYDHLAKHLWVRDIKFGVISRGDAHNVYAEVQRGS